MTVHTLKIGGAHVAGAAGQSVLEVAVEHGIDIPTLCHLEGLSDVGACRLCVVELGGSGGLTSEAPPGAPGSQARPSGSPPVDSWSGRLLPACTTACEEGMEVVAHSERLAAYRRTIIEMLFVERNHICPVCVANNHCELQDLAYELGVDHLELPAVNPVLGVDASHDRFAIDHDRCVLCTRCVRVCDEIEGAHTWDVSGRGVGARVVTDLGTPWGESPTCTSWGKCVQVCPTGALFEKGGRWRRAPRTGVRSCPTSRSRATGGAREPPAPGDRLAGRLLGLPHVLPGHGRAPVRDRRACRAGLQPAGGHQGLPGAGRRLPGRGRGLQRGRPAQDPPRPHAHAGLLRRLRGHHQRAGHAQPDRTRTATAPRLPRERQRPAGSARPGGARAAAQVAAGAPGGAGGRVINLAQVVQSNALSFFHLSSPDLLFGFDAEPARRSLLGVLAEQPQLARDGVAVRRFGQQITEWLGGKRIHSSWVVPGGVDAPLDAGTRDRALAEVPTAAVERALAWYEASLLRWEEEAARFGSFRSAFMGLVDRDGAVDHYDGLLRVIDADGRLLADRVDPRPYWTYLGEAVEPWSYLKSAYWKELGYPGGSGGLKSEARGGAPGGEADPSGRPPVDRGSGGLKSEARGGAPGGEADPSGRPPVDDGVYRVGPLARLNVADRLGTPRAEAELAELRDRLGRVPGSSFYYHYARLIDMLYPVERIEALLNDPEILSPQVRSRAGVNRDEGIGVAEAPRGTLMHHYKVDADGIAQWANLVIATGHDNLAMNRSVLQVARHCVKGDQLRESMLNRVEAAIRCYDLCLSCSTHAVGAMPLNVQLLSPSGAVLDELWR